jgi:hypothetical protein
MPLVLFSVSFDQRNPRDLPADARAVRAEPYLALDDGQGGLTAAEVDPHEVERLDAFELGADLYVESSDPEDALDDTDEETERLTRIWWRASLVGAIGPGGSA